MVRLINVMDIVYVFKKCLLIRELQRILRDVFHKSNMGKNLNMNISADPKGYGY